MRGFNNIKHQYQENQRIQFIQELTYQDINLLYPTFICIDNFSKFGLGFYIVSDIKKLSNIANIQEYNPKFKQTEFKYLEPQSKVISRTNNECVVAYSDQWFINYGDAELKEKVNEYLENNFKAIPSVLTDLKIATNWLAEWPCSRNYGLGSYIPNTTDLIDSLSDSTIYMAYYTIANRVENLPIEFVNNDMWNYVFLDKQFISTNNEEYDNIIHMMKKEFEYWYPVDIRVSGKDLIPNHLTMALFNHYAIWGDFNKMPKEYIINGYLMLDNQKMSKSTGNFKTLRDAICEYGVNVLRFVLASSNSGNGTDDGNFMTELCEPVANKLFREMEFIMGEKGGEKIGELTFFDKVFLSQIGKYMEDAYNSYINNKYRFAITSFYQLRNAKNIYIENCNKCGYKIKENLIEIYCKNIMQCIYPICPHWVEYIILKTNKYHESRYWNKQTVEYKKEAYLFDILDDVITQSKKLVSKNKNKTKLIITVYGEFSEFEKDLINNYINNIDVQQIMENKKLIGMCKQFTKYITKNIETYGNKWLEWIDNTKENREIGEYEILTTYLPILTNYNFEIKYAKSNTGLAEKMPYNISNPKIEMI
jgi:leucyl-tRNA synthetase